MTEEELQAEHAAGKHNPRTNPVTGCPNCAEWRARHRCIGLGASDVALPPPDEGAEG